MRWSPKYGYSRLGWEPLKIMTVGFLPLKDTGRRTIGPTACCSPQNNLSIRPTYRNFPRLQDLFLKNLGFPEFFLLTVLLIPF